MHARLIALLPSKLAGVGLLLAGTIAYVAVQLWRGRDAIAVPAAPWDGMVPAWPWLAWPYLAQLAIFGLPTWWIDERQRMARHLAGWVAIVGVSLLVFILVPTAVVRPPADGPAWQFIQGYDTTANAFPSLHAACAVYAVLQARLLRNWPAWATPVAWAWTALVFVACLGLRQHTTWDLAAGAALAVAVHRWTLRP
ncbi:hypothetical protein LBMAG53_12220 [Planctomycetota bacterium]|nr:hypothetical protein LBMAG53_12220 [Planctomycetota bacterium]